MVLTSKELFELSQIACEAAKEAGDFIQNFTREDILVDQKEEQKTRASQVVTQVDIKSQEIILEKLAPSIKKFNLGLLTEESADDNSRFSNDYFWCIDPLDGTLSFIENKYGYAVSIALVSRSGESLIGVVYDPIKSDLYYAFRSGGVYKNNAKIELSEPSNNLNVFIDRSALEAEEYKGIIEKISGQYNPVVGMGAVMNAISIINNPPGCYFKIPKSGKGGGSIWDFAATACIFNEQGLTCIDFTANNLPLNRRNTTFMNESGVIYSTNNSIANLIIKLAGN
ncbi:3'(2'),5'-bisphosphate nucleotidase CysQ family protein [Marinigracilibium pacificum]|uniref:Inositol monophosphatase n=1 Tax=Marinigracilibium pacificum TaxID=2729599 RepID=A0A848IZE2_9BACT|nr:inositol monophosphatase family protein [Marinigracilibium pacificum]NMM48518.1 inositol monophosphatase [Marinigracilibium pacificum]